VSGGEGVGLSRHVITRDALQKWCIAASAGERLIYARAEQLPQPIGAAARALADAGLVTLARGRASLIEPFDFFAIRLGKAFDAPIGCGSCSARA
jgi:hypothetical protein